MVRAVNLCLLAALAVASVSGKSLRGRSSSEIAADVVERAPAYHLIRRTQDDDGTDDNNDDNNNSNNNNNNDDDDVDDGAVAPVATPKPTKATPKPTKATPKPANGTAAGDDCDCDDDGVDDDDDDDSCACKKMPNLDVAILQFALNLEYLEAEFYSWAAFGEGLPECAANSTGGMKANLTAPFQAYAEEIALNEIAHVKFLQTALGNDTVPCPALDIGEAFAAAANVATNMTLEPPYSPYYDDKWFLLGAFIFEDVGVTAYNGAAPLLTNKTILGAAAGILAVEAYHAGTVRTLLTMVKDEPLTPYPLTVAAGVQAVSDLRAKVGGGKDAGIVRAPYNATAYNATATDDDDMDDDMMTDDSTRRLKHEATIFAANGTMGANATQIVPADKNALAFARNATEVLSIVYLGNASVPGGFFPEGLNGMLK